MRPKGGTQISTMQIKSLNYERKSLIYEDWETKMTDSDFLRWLAERLVNVYKEDPNTDFVLKLKSIADELEDAAYERMEERDYDDD